MPNDMLSAAATLADRVLDENPGITPSGIARALALPRLLPTGDIAIQYIHPLSPAELGPIAATCNSVEGSRLTDNCRSGLDLLRATATRALFEQMYERHGAAVDRRLDRAKEALRSGT